jgi:mono/diheme cytochrome c family protein
VPVRPKRAAAAIALVGLAVLMVLALLTRARPSSVERPDHIPDPERGEVMYHAGGCISCHKMSDEPGMSGPPAGGASFETPVGTFWPGNLTPDPETGLGGWTAGQFVDAMRRGVSPDGRHYFPAFPYTSYRLMPVGDVLDLWAYLGELEPVDSPTRKPEVAALGLARRAVGLWKLAAPNETGFRQDSERTESWNRGAYLTNGPGHCGECHTPRNALMIPDETRAMAGGPHPRGDEGQVPSLLDLEGRERYDSVSDLVLALQYGETLGYDKLSSGGMADVQRNLAKLPEAELQAMAEYLLSLE